jgi:hypothetical protein
MEVIVDCDTCTTVVNRRSWADRTGPVAVAGTVDADRIVRTWLAALDSLP